jgi:hypothetical protein
MPIEAPRAPADKQPAPEHFRQHWLVDVARRAKLANSELLIVPAFMSTETAWAKIIEICNIRDDELTRHVAGAGAVCRADQGRTAARRKLVLVPPRAGDGFTPAQELA